MYIKLYFKIKTGWILGTLLEGLALKHCICLKPNYKNFVNHNDFN